MLNKNLIEFAKTISFTVKDDSAFGFVDNFLVSIYESSNTKNTYIYYTLKSEKTYKNDSPVSIMTISGNLSDVFKKYNITNYSVKENGIRISCLTSYANFYKIIKDTVAELSKINALKTNICSECGEEILSSDIKFRISTNGINMLLCSQCADYLLGDENSENDTENDTSNEDSTVTDELTENDCEDTLEEVPEKKNTSDKKVDKDANDSNVADKECPSENKKGSTVKGIFGSLLFGFGISACIILLYTFVVPTGIESSFKSGYYVNWISSFTAVAAYFGYKIFSKEDNNIKQILCPAIISAILVIITQCISSVVLLARERFFIYEQATWNRFFKALPEFMKSLINDPATSSDFKIYIMMDLIFVIVALLIISFFIAPKSDSNEETIIEKI